MTQNTGKRLGQSIHCRENLKNLLPTENSHEQADRLPERRSPTSDSQANALVPNYFSNWFWSFRRYLRVFRYTQMKHCSSDIESNAPPHDA